MALSVLQRLREPRAQVGCSGLESLAPPAAWGPPESRVRESREGSVGRKCSQRFPSAPQGCWVLRWGSLTPAPVARRPLAVQRDRVFQGSRARQLIFVLIIIPGCGPCWDRQQMWWVFKSDKLLLLQIENYFQGNDLKK